MRKLTLYLFFTIFCANIFAQKILTEQQVIDTTVNSNYLLANALLKIEAQKALQKTSWNISNPEVLIEQNPFESLTLSVEQVFDFPTLYVKQGKLNKEKVVLSELEFSLEKNELIKNIRQLYLQVQYTTLKLSYLQIQDSIFQQVKNATIRLFEAGNADYLQKIFAETKYGGVHQLYVNNQAELVRLKQNIFLLTGVQYEFTVTELIKLNPKSDSILITENPLYLYAKQNIDVAKWQYQVVRESALPNILLGYTVPLQENAVYVPAFKAGISIPLWYNSYRGYNMAARAEISIAENNMNAQEQNILLQKASVLAAFFSNEQTLKYYEMEGLRNANEVIKTATRLNEVGEIDIMNYLRTLSEAFEIRLNYIETLRNYNSSVIEIDYLNGK